MPEAELPPQNDALPQNRLMTRLRDFANSGAVKGIVVVAAVMIGALALAGGAMGAGLLGHLLVNGVQMSGFNAGAVAGIAKAMEFITSGFGLTMIGAGGVAGSLIQAKKNRDNIARDKALIAEGREQAVASAQTDLAPATQLPAQPAQQPDAQKDASATPDAEALKEKYAPLASDAPSTPLLENSADKAQAFPPQNKQINGQMYDQGYLDGLKTAQNSNAMTVPETQNLTAPDTALPDAEAIKEKYAPLASDAPSAPLLENTADKVQAIPLQNAQINDQVYNQGYLDGLKTAQNSNAMTIPETQSLATMDNAPSASAASASTADALPRSDSGSTSTPTVVNVQNVVADHHYDGDTINADINAPTKNEVNTLVNADVNAPVNNVSQTAVAMAQTTAASSPATDALNDVPAPTRGRDGRIVTPASQTSGTTAAASFASAVSNRRAEQAASNEMTR